MTSTARRRLVRTTGAIAPSLALLVAALACAFGAAEAGLEFTARLNLRQPPLAALDPPPERSGPALTRRVVLLVMDGLGREAATRLDVLGHLRRRGVDAIASAHVPTLSRPNYVSILTGVPPAQSGVRSNEYSWPVPLDSLLHRLRAAGRETAFATDAAPGFGTMFAGQLSEAAMTPWAGGLDRAGALALGRRYPLVVLIAGAVDRAGHHRGAASAEYAAAAQAVDAQLGRLLSELDLARDTVIVTADHGHTERGGHGGREPIVLRVPLIMAGAGVRPGTRVDQPRLIDIAPTVAALLGVPAPRHALGRTLVEALAVDGVRAGELRAADRTRRDRNLAWVEEARRAGAPHAATLFGRLRAAVVPLALFLFLGAVAVRAGALRLDRRVWLVAAVGYPAALVALLIAAHTDLSLSTLSSRADAESCVLWAGVWAAATQLVASLFLLRRRGGHLERLATASGLAGAGLFLAHIGPAAVHVAFGSPPWLDLPPAPMLLLIPGLEIALATYAAAVAFSLGLELVVFLARVGISAAPAPDSVAGNLPAGHTGETTSPQRWARLFG